MFTQRTRSRVNQNIECSEWIMIITLQARITSGGASRTRISFSLVNPNLIISIPSKYLNDSCKVLEWQLQMREWQLQVREWQLQVREWISEPVSTWMTAANTREDPEIEPERASESKKVKLMMLCSTVRHHMMSFLNGQNRRSSVSARIRTDQN